MQYLHEFLLNFIFCCYQASGAGKSTLLDVLANRKTTGEIRGKVLFDGEERSIATNRSSAYVMQDNIHIAVLTVRQTLTYAAHLRMPETVSLKEKNIRINKVLDLLGLTSHENDIVGNEIIRGLSGGQVKRLSIGVEIINLPTCIFLDEPTTGLDSSIAYEVIFAIRNLANQQRTIICTIHQPSTKIYAMLDKLLLLAHGRVIYYGPAKMAVGYFVSSPFAYAFVRGSNPSDFIISVAGSFLADSKGRFVSGDELADFYSKTEMSKTFGENITTVLNIDRVSKKVTALSNDYNESNGYITSTWYQINVLMNRAFYRTIKELKPALGAAFRLVHILFGT